MRDDEAKRRFTAIYDANRQRVWAYAVSRAGRGIADEVVSETFAVGWRRLADIPEPPLPWLLGVARNVLRDSYRAQARRDSLAAELGTWTDPSMLAGEDVAETVTERLSVLGALKSLPESDRELLILIAWQGLRPQDAGQVVGCSTAALRVRLLRARRRLVRALDAVQPGQERPARAEQTLAHDVAEELA